MNTVKITPLEIPDILLVETLRHTDERGFFEELYKKSGYTKLGLPKFVQDNLSFSKKGVLRGLHFQVAPKPQGKLVRALKGTIWDVVADVRANSENYKKWVAVELDEGRAQALYVPPGFAHGFLTVSDSALVLYKTTFEYDPNLEKGINWKDQDLKINWPIQNPILSQKDNNLPELGNVKYF